MKDKIVNISLVAIATFSLLGCGSSSSDNTVEPQNPTVTTTSYAGAGSRWELDFKSDGSTTIKELNSNLEINATTTELASGFKKITVISSNDSNVSSGDTRYGFELPGYMFPFVSFTENKLLPTINMTNECPTEGIKHNYITSFAKSNSNTDGTFSNFDGWGTFGYWDLPYTADGTAKIEVFKRDGTRNGNDNVSSFSVAMLGCTNGRVYNINDDPNDDWRATTTAYFTKSGALIWQQEGRGNTVGTSINNRIENDFMIPYEGNLTNIDQIDGNYIGYVITGNGQSTIGYSNIPVSVSISSANFTVKEINPDTNTTGTTISTISLTTELTGTKGLWYGQVTTTGTEGIGCAVDLNANNSSKNVIICGGMNPDGTLEKLYSLILVSK